MQREEQPILIVDETRVDVVLHIGRFAVQLSANVCSLYGLAVLIFSFIRDLPGLGLPNPRTGEIHSGELCVEGVADRINLPERVKAIGLGNLFGNGRALLRAGRYSKDQHSEKQKADYRYSARLLHGVPSSVK